MTCIRSMTPRILPLAYGVLLSLSLFAHPAAAYDQPWNGGKEDITSPAPPPESPCPSGNCSCPGASNTSSPIYTADGSLVWRDSDIQFAGTSQLSLRRTYNSFDFRAGLFGRGWVTAQESNIARTYKALTEGNADYSPKTATEFQSTPIWLAEYGRRYELQESATECKPPQVLSFTFEKLPDGRFKQRYSDSLSYSLYSASGVLLQSYSDQTGSSIYYSYDLQRRLIRQVDSYGYALNFSYNDQGFVSEVKDHANRVWQYSYDSYGRLEQVIDPDGNSKNYSYQTIDKVGYQQHLLTAVDDNGDDPALRVTWSEVTLKNGKSQRVASYTLSDGRRHDYVYADVTYAGKPAIRVTKTTKQIASETTIDTNVYIADAGNYSILEHSNSTDSTRITRTYNERNALIEERDARGNLTRYEYNDAGRVIKTTEFAGTANERITTRSYYSDTDRVAVFNEYGLRETRYQYDSDLRVTQETQVDLNSGEERNWKYTYHPNTRDSEGNTVLGKLATLDGPAPGSDDLQRFSYNAQGLLIQIDYPLSQTVRFSYNTAGQQTEVTDVNGITTELRYDSRNHVVQIQKHGRSRSYSYNAQDLITQTTDELGRVTQFAYDEYNQPVRITEPSGDYMAVGYVYATSYTEITRQYFQVDGELISTGMERQHPLSNLPLDNYLADTSTPVSNQTYNGFDDLTRQIRYGQFGAASSATYNYTYDYQGRLTRIRDPLNRDTDFTYDKFQHLTRVSDPNRGVTQFTYNAWDKPLTQTSPDTGTTRFEYAANGALSARLDANNQSIAYHYDALDRLNAIDYADDELDISFEYDQGGNAKGLLTGVSDASGSTSYQYNSENLLQNTEHRIAGISLTTAYAYIENGDIKQLTYPSGAQLRWTYDAFGRVNDLQLRDKDVTTALLRNLQWRGNQVASYEQGNGLVTELIYDNAGRLIEKRFGSEANRLQNQLDNQNQITQQTWVRAGLSSGDNYEYDPLSRLQLDGNVANDFDWRFTYDPNGNRLSQERSDTSERNNYLYEANSNRLRDVDGNSINRDAVGNTLSDTERDYRYNANQQLVQVTHRSKATVANYSYNYQSQRVRKQVSGSDSQDIRYVYGQQGELLGEYDASGNRIREYVYLNTNGNNELFAQLEADGSIIYIHTDHLGTPRLASNQSKVMVWGWMSDAFGTTAPNQDLDGDSNITTINQRFPGQYFDQESGLHYNYFRYYDPQIGRYITSDPIGLDGGVNTYLYANANPLLHVDLLGLAVGADSCSEEYVDPTKPPIEDPAEEPRQCTKQPDCRKCCINAHIERMAKCLGKAACTMESVHKSTACHSACIFRK